MRRQCGKRNLAIWRLIPIWRNLAGGNLANWRIWAMRRINQIGESPNGPQMGPKWAPNGPQMGPKWAPNGLQMGPKWAPNGTPMGPKWDPNGPAGAGQPVQPASRQAKKSANRAKSQPTGKRLQPGPFGSTGPAC